MTQRLPRLQSFPSSVLTCRILSGCILCGLKGRFFSAGSCRMIQTATICVRANHLFVQLFYMEREWYSSRSILANSEGGTRSTSTLKRLSGFRRTSQIPVKRVSITTLVDLPVCNQFSWSKEHKSVGTDSATPELDGRFDADRSHWHLFE